MMLTICIFWNPYLCYYIPFRVWDGLSGVSLVRGSLQKRCIQPILGYKTMVALLLEMSSLPLPVSLSGSANIRAIFGKIKKRPSWGNEYHPIYPQPVTGWAGLQSMCYAWMRLQSCSLCRLVTTHHHMRNAFRMISAKHPHLPDSFLHCIPNIHLLL